MSNIGEAQITRLTRERLAAIKKFLPVRDSFRDNLQARQQSRMDFTTDTQRLFEPITTVTETVGKKTQEYLKTLPKDIVEAQLTNIPVIPPPAAGIPPPAAGIPPPPAEVIPPKQKRVPFIERFDDDMIKEIRKPILKDRDDFSLFGTFAADSYHNKREFFKDEYKQDPVKRDDFVDWMYKINQNITNIKSNDENYVYFKTGVDSYIIKENRRIEEEKQRQRQRLQQEVEEEKERIKQRREGQKKEREEEKKQKEELKKQKEEQKKQEEEEKKTKKTRKRTKKRTRTRKKQQTTPRGRGRPKKEQPDPDSDPLTKLLSPEKEEEEITGQGYHRKKSKNFHRNHTSIPCSRNILDDVSRLEVLIGEKRAGNNSPQITNEATEICQRLFQGKVIGMGLYRNLVNELIDADYYSD